MRSKIKLGLIGAGSVVFTAIVFWIGMAIGMRFGSGKLESELNSTQAMLAFNRVLDERKLELLLSKGCVAQALAKTDVAIDQNTKLLATLSKARLSPWVNKYIADRDPDFLPTLDGFKSKYGDSWTEKECK